MAAIDDLWQRLDAHPRAVCFARPAVGVLLWRPIDPGSLDEWIQRLPDGAASLAWMGGQRWLRHVAANPVVDSEGLWKAIDRSLVAP